MGLCPSVRGTRNLPGISTPEEEGTGAGDPDLKFYLCGLVMKQSCAYVYALYTHKFTYMPGIHRL